MTYDESGNGSDNGNEHRTGAAFIAAPACPEVPIVKRRSHTIIIALLLLLLTLPLQAFAAKGVVLNFTDVDISTMVKFISDLTGRNFVMDERVKGKISVYSPAKLSPEEAFNVFTSVLELKGFTLIQAGRVNKIVPTAAAKQLGTRLLTDAEKVPVNETYVARVISLENVAPQEAVTFLQPLVSKDGYIAPFGPANMVLVVDSALNIRKLLEIVDLIDTEKPREKAELVFLQHAAADALSKVVQEWLAGRAGKAPTQPGQPAQTGGLVVADTRLNALVVFGSDKDKEEVKRFVALLDVPPPTTSSKVNVYYMENADATEVAKVLDGVVKGSAAAPAPGQPATAPQQSPFEGGKITITPDKATNSLVVMASPNDYQNLLQVIQKLDKRRRQVFVQALIAEVSLDKLKSLGVQWGALGGSSNNTATVAGSYDPQGVFNQLFSVLSALKGAGITIPDLTGTPVNFAVAIQALETNGIANVLSTPNILTSDNKEAEIFVGENVPFRGSITYNSSLPNSAQQSIERKDTGITLKITPQVSEGEYVKLDIYQEISAVKDANSTGAAADITTTKRSAKTSVVVKNQETVAIAGLIQDKEQESYSKVPILGDIPLLGWLFKTKNKSRNKTNLMILLTPRVIKDARDLAEVSERQREKLDEAIKRTTPLDIPAALKQPAKP
ncbi:type II secretion system secretin GspD [Geobacter argillaceus]|uniref:General secretion pathway protein D n=1 Tax=Geobacter argillaceus TaxID=345631 RepID=A0A562WS79_9BACT|nr:type II secretion system secretin GspD [Geobacter argillaceus]TWJ33458.1 general secretion pathway protein D [Geobacter argillaceus]